MPPIPVLLHSWKTPPAWQNFVRKCENFFYRNEFEKSELEMFKVGVATSVRIGLWHMSLKMVADNIVRIS